MMKNSDENNHFSVPGSRKRTIKPALVSPPRIEGALYDFLVHASERETGEKLNVAPGYERFVLRDSEEIAIVGTCLIFMDNILRASGTRLNLQRLESLLSEMLSLLGPADVMQLEIESYNTLQWLSKTLQQYSDKKQKNGSKSKKLPTVSDKIQEAIVSGTDLMIWYYAGSSGEFSSRRITPLRLEAEKFLTAFCHLRKQERTFRLNRISRVEPVVDDLPQDDLQNSCTKHQGLKCCRKVFAQHGGIRHEIPLRNQIQADSLEESRRQRQAPCESANDKNASYASKEPFSPGRSHQDSDKSLVARADQTSNNIFQEKPMLLLPSKEMTHSADKVQDALKSAIADGSGRVDTRERKNSRRTSPPGKTSDGSANGRKRNRAENKNDLVCASLPPVKSGANKSSKKLNEPEENSSKTSKRKTKSAKQGAIGKGSVKPVRIPVQQQLFDGFENPASETRPPFNRPVTTPEPPSETESENDSGNNDSWLPF